MPHQSPKTDIQIFLYCLYHSSDERHANTFALLSFFTVDSISSDQWIISFVFTVNKSLILYVQRIITACNHSLLIKYKGITILFLILFLITFLRLLTRWLLSGFSVPFSLPLLFFTSAPVWQFYRTAIIGRSTVAALWLLKMLQFRATFLIIHQSNA